MLIRQSTDSMTLLISGVPSSNVTLNLFQGLKLNLSLVEFNNRFNFQAILAREGLDFAIKSPTKPLLP
jgi:hypothetical protein